MSSSKRVWDELYEFGETSRKLVKLLHDTDQVLLAEKFTNEVRDPFMNNYVNQLLRQIDADYGYYHSLVPVTPEVSVSLIDDQVTGEIEPLDDISTISCSSSSTSSSDVPLARRITIPSLHIVVDNFIRKYITVPNNPQPYENPEHVVSFHDIWEIFRRDYPEFKMVQVRKEVAKCIKKRYGIDIVEPRDKRVDLPSSDGKRRRSRHYWEGLFLVQ